jgi:hypothetical protein
LIRREIKGHYYKGTEFFSSAPEYFGQSGWVILKQFCLATSATNFMMFLNSLQILIVLILRALLSGFTTLQPLLFPKNQFSLVSSACFSSNNHCFNPACTVIRVYHSSTSALPEKSI